MPVFTLLDRVICYSGIFSMHYIRANTCYCFSCLWYKANLVNKITDIFNRII